MEWPGCRSQRFRGGKHQYPQNIHFESGTMISHDMPQIGSGRRHFEEIESSRVNLPDKRMGIRHIDKPSETIDIVERRQGIRSIQFEPIGTKERAERLHIRDNHEPITTDQKPLGNYRGNSGIKTSGDVAKEALRHYYVEDRMQRKIRARQPNRTNYFRNEGFEDHSEPHP